MIVQVMVRRFSRALAMRPVTRIKHVVDSQFSTALGVVETTNIALAVDSPALANITEVETGSVIKSIFVSAEVVNTGVTGVLANCYFMIYKNPGGNLNMPNPNVVGSNDNKRYVFHQEMLMLQMIDNSNPRTLFKGVLVVPRHLQRMGPNDIIRTGIFSPGVEISGCIQAHYKELR